MCPGTNAIQLIAAQLIPECNKLECLNSANIPTLDLQFWKVFLGLVTFLDDYATVEISAAVKRTSLVRQNLNYVSKSFITLGKGKAVTYSCNAGGINAFEVKIWL